MVQYCAVPCCNNNAKTRGISFFSFPRDSLMRKRWILKIRRDERINPVSDTMRVCSAHFKDADFVSSKNGKRRLLRKAAVPSIFQFASIQMNSRPLDKYASSESDDELLNEMLDSSQQPNLQVLPSVASETVFLPVESDAFASSNLSLPVIFSVSTVVPKDSSLTREGNYKKRCISESESTCSSVNGQTSSSVASRIDLLAKKWADKMKTLDDDQLIFAERLIDDVLYVAESGHLGHGSHIVLNMPSE